MELWFKGQNTRKIADVESLEEAFKEINKFCEERNFKIYYTRSWMEDNEMWFDVGSHTEFFLLKDFTENEEKPFTN